MTDVYKHFPWAMDKKPVPEKQEERERLEQETAKFLENGGQIQQIPKGESAIERDRVVFMEKKIRGKPRGK